MIERVIEFCARNRFIVILCVAAAAVYAAWSLERVPLDAIPDLSDTQVIVYSKWPGRSPDIMEDQVTYPIVTSLLGAPSVKDIRGFSDFGFSYVYVLFEDGTDIYWARSRVLEYLSKIIPSLPEGVQTEMGPDATGVGWVFEYALVDRSGRNDLSELRSFQDWYLRYYLQGVEGVAEVATFGGFVRQYQVTIDPNLLLAHNLSVTDVGRRIRASNNEVGGRLLEFAGTEYMVRGRGYIESVEDLEQIVIRANPQGVPLLLRDIARVQLGPDIRRGVADLDGEGDVVGGIVVMRYGENALTVIERVKARVEELREQEAFPEGVELVVTYDRSELIKKSIATLTRTLTHEMIVVAVVIFIFLLHAPSSFVPVLTLPVAVLLSFIPMLWMDVGSNIMSLGGIAVAIGAMVDAAIVLVENTHKKIEAWRAEGGGKGDYREVIIEAAKEVGRPAFFALLVIAVSFIPIFALEEQEGRLFKPLAYTKNLAMFMAAILAVSLSPAVLLAVTRLKRYSFRPRFLAAVVNAVVVGKIWNEEKHPVSRLLHRLYEPVVNFVLRWPKAIIILAALAVLCTVPAYLQLGKEFMPPLNEGSILYMPTTLPGISVTEAMRILQTQDKIFREFPEVERVFGKIGRADTSTDPAPFAMVETTVLLKPPNEWRRKERWYSPWAPGWVQAVLRPIWPDRISWDELVDGMDKAMRFPGWTNAWTMPIKARIDMLTTGVRTPVGIKIMGSDLEELERIGERIEAALQDVPGTRSVFAERVAGGYFFDFDPRREELARYGLTIDDVHEVVMGAIGGQNISTTIEGRERYPINIRYPRELRDDLARLERVLVNTPSGANVPLAQLADLRYTTGPGMIRNENGMLASYVYVDFDTAKRDVGSYVADAKRAVNERVDLPEGYFMRWSGQYESMERVKEKLILVVPITIFIIFMLLFFNTRSVAKTLIVLLAIPFSAIGAVWLLYALGYNISIGVWVGLIALLGLDAETGVFMLVYLDLAYDERKRRGRMRTLADLKDAIHHGAVQRVRPKVMTVATTFAGLLPLMWSAGTGADLMKRIAAPMVGGLFTSFLMELAVYPAVYLLWKWHGEVKHSPLSPAPDSGSEDGTGAPALDGD